MLVLTRRLNEEIKIGKDIIIKIAQVKGCQVRLGITAPKDIPITRPESQ